MADDQDIYSQAARELANAADDARYANNALVAAEKKTVAARAYFHSADDAFEEARNKFMNLDRLLEEKTMTDDVVGLLEATDPAGQGTAQ